jgi:hypothetical protein
VTNQSYRLFQAAAFGENWTGDGLKHTDSSEDEEKNLSVAAYLDNNATEEN